MQKNRGSQPDNGSPEQSLTPDQLTWIMESGEKAAQLLQAPIFNHAHQSVVQQLFQEWAGTEPKEVNKRESLYATLQGAARYSQYLANAVHDAQRAMQANAEQQSSQRAQDRYLDEQGFGLNFD